MAANYGLPVLMTGSGPTLFALLPEGFRQTREVRMALAEKRLVDPSGPPDREREWRSGPAGKEEKRVERKPLAPIDLDSYKPLRELVFEALREAIITGSCHRASG